MATNNHSTVTAEQYLAELEAHDWYYEYSDDHRDWKKGNEHAKLLRSLREGNEELEALHSAYVDYKFHGGEKPEAKPAATESEAAATTPVFNYRNFSKLVADGHIFTVEFIKRTTGELRKMKCRTGVKKHLKGGTLAYSPKDNGLLTVYDLEAKGYRSIPVQNVQRLSVGGQTFTFGGVV